MKPLAQYLIAENKAGLFAARRQSDGSRCPRVYLPGGALGARETLEGLCARQGWRISRGEKIHEEETERYKVQWFTGTAEPSGFTQKSTPQWADRDTIERHEHLHDGALDVYEEMKGA